MDATAVGIEKSPIGAGLLKAIYASDQDMYPAPLTFNRLKSWVDGCPQLCVSFKVAQETEHGACAESKGAPVDLGAIIVLPILKPYWEDILAGRLKETDIDPTLMFAAQDPVEVGLHIFHIERFDTATPSNKLRHFAEFALAGLQETIEKTHWSILGYSALTATPAGRAVCKRMGFRPTGYQEIFVQSGDKIDMVCVYPDQNPDVPVEEDLILSSSQMVVRYQAKHVHD